MTSLLVPAARLQHEIEVKRSRFIATVGRAANREAAEAFITAVRQQYPDATHNAYAYIAGQPGSTGDVACSDDGEVAGTAGRPMLNLLQHSGLGEIVAVVSRYYGGTLLGTGGLVRAYSDVLKAALAQLPTQACVTLIMVRMVFDFALEAAVRRELARVAAEVLQQEYSDAVQLTLRLPISAAASVQQLLQSLSKGRLQWQVLEPDDAG